MILCGLAVKMSLLTFSALFLKDSCYRVSLRVKNITVNIVKIAKVILFCNICWTNISWFCLIADKSEAFNNLFLFLLAWIWSMKTVIKYSFGTVKALKHTLPAHHRERKMQYHFQYKNMTLKMSHINESVGCTRSWSNFHVYLNTSHFAVIVILWQLKCGGEKKKNKVNKGQGSSG